MRLIYEWINESDEKKFDGSPVVSNLNLNFSDDFVAFFDASNSVLTVKRKKTKIPADFYNCDCVESVNCIVGVNGCGKTTILKHIYKTEMYHPTRESNKTIQIYEEDGTLVYYSNVKIKRIVSENIVIQKIPSEKYSNHSKIFITNDPFGYINLNGSDFGQHSLLALTPYDVNAFSRDIMGCLCLQEDGMLWHKDNFETYNSFFSYPRAEFALHLMYFLLFRDALKNGWNSFNYINEFKITVSKDYCLDNIESNSSLNLFQAFQHVFQGKEMDILKDCVDVKSREKLSSIYKIDYENKKQIFQIFAIYNLVTRSRQESKSVVSILKNYLKTEILYSLYDFNNAGTICDLVEQPIDALLSFFKKQRDENLQIDEKRYQKRRNDESEYFENAYNQLNKLESIVGNETALFCSLGDATKRSTDLLDFLFQEITSKRSFILKYIFFTFKMSGGERAFLNIFAYINSLQYLKYLSKRNTGNLYDNVLLLLDEPDLMCHPEWQRKMVKNLIEMCRCCFIKNKVQIIMTTHSPLMLSDFPKENVITIDKNATLSTMECQTFGSNIYDLYKDSFFLEEYFGEFAETVINNTADAVYKAFELCHKDEIDSVNIEELNRAISIVELIGEPLLKNGLENAIEYIKGKIKHD